MSMFRNLLSKKAVIPQIILNPNSLEYNKEAGVKNLQIRSNTQWTLEFKENEEKQ